MNEALEILTLTRRELFRDGKILRWTDEEILSASRALVDEWLIDPRGEREAVEGDLGGWAIVEWERVATVAEIDDFSAVGHIEQIATRFGVGFDRAMEVPPGVLLLDWLDRTGGSFGDFCDAARARRVRREDEASIDDAVAAQVREVEDERLLDEVGDGDPA